MKIKQQTLHMIGNAHIDPVWLWQWQEGFQEVKATFRSVLDRMNEFVDFIFTSSSAQYYEWIEEHDPAMFDEIRARVQEGRWVIVGGWWVQPDCNIPSGESFARQALYSQRYFKAKFGVTATVGYCVDSFGHNAMLPQLLQKSGMEAYVFMRPQPHEKGLPAPVFWWEADNGSRVLTARIPFEYAMWGKHFEQHIRRCAAEIKAPLNALICFYGVGNHGGGPTQENIETIRALNHCDDVPQLVFSSPDQFFASIDAQKNDLPVIHDELQYHARGCYSAHSGIKRWNRLAENRLLAAEKFSAIADRRHGTRRQTTQDALTRAWKNVLFNQFHDILAGTCIQPAYDDAHNAYGEAMTIADRVLNDAVQTLAWQIRIEPEAEMKPIVVFNPNTWRVKTNVELEVGGLRDDHVLLDDADRRTPLQRIQSHAAVGGRHRIAFIADLPSLGYRVYRLVARANERNTDTAVLSNEYVLENQRWQIQFDPTTGYLKRLFDKKFQTQVFHGDAAMPVVIDDPSDTWAHDVSAFNRVIGAFKAQSVRLVERGPVKSVMRVISTYGASRLVQEFAIYRDLDQIDVHITVDWHEQFKMLKLRFPLNLHLAKATFEIPYGHIQRAASGAEEPYQAWLDVTGATRDSNRLYGLSILNDGKYSADVNGADIGFTVLRSPIYAHHTPLPVDENKWYAFIDQGMQKFNYALLPHDASWESADTVRRAAELNQRPITLIETFHPNGRLPQSDSFIGVEPDTIVVSVVKRAEDNDDLIVRAYETSKHATHATICLPKFKRVIEANFAPCEIKTFRVPRAPDQPIVETDLIEW